MDIIITAVGEFIWTASCAVVNFCVSSGVSVIAVFVSFLCAIFASAFYKYTTSREQMSVDDDSCAFVNQNNDDLNKFITITSTTESLDTSLIPETIIEEVNNVNDIEPLETSFIPDESNNTNDIQSLAEIEICIEENTNGSENETVREEVSNDILIDRIEGSEEEIQKQQIANIYRLLNDQHLINNWTTTDFLDQLKMYGLHQYDEEELESN